MFLNEFSLKRIFKNMKYSLVFILLVVLTGCASVYKEKAVTISVPAISDSLTASDLFANLSPVSLEVVDGRNWRVPGLSVKLGRFQVGLSRNSFGEQIDPVIILAEPVDALLRRFIVNEIELHGARVKGDRCPLLKIEVKDFFGDFEVKNFAVLVLKTAVAELKVVVTVQSRDGYVNFNKLISVSAKSEVGLMTTEVGAIEMALSSALHKGINSMLIDPELLSALSAGHHC